MRVIKRGNGATDWDRYGCFFPRLVS